ncbi:MAG: GreA/GreB family elongation factor [Candidatus Shapirobacteria bacterium]
MTKQQLTKDGFQKLQQELAKLNQKASELVDRLEEVAQPDESGEDSLAAQLKAELEVVNNKISGYEDVLANVEIVSDKVSNTNVSVGSTVKVEIAGKTKKDFQIVSEFEADPIQNKISDQSPLGIALLGKKINHKFEIEAPAGRLTYKIVSIN